MTVCCVDRSQGTSREAPLAQIVRQHFGKVTVTHMSVCAPPAALDSAAGVSLRTVCLARLNLRPRVICFLVFFMGNSLVPTTRDHKDKQRVGSDT